VTLLARLARLAGDQNLKGQGMGQFMPMDALHRSLQAAAGMAAMAVVDAKRCFGSRFLSTR
jgi:hypothetical protein